jgi:hypothetical protein
LRLILTLLCLLSLNQALRTNQAAAREKSGGMMNVHIDPLTRYFQLTYRVPKEAPEEVSVLCTWSPVGRNDWRPARVMPLLSETALRLTSDTEWRQWTEQGRLTERRAAGLSRTVVFNPYPEAQSQGRADCEFRIQVQTADGRILADAQGGLDHVEGHRTVGLVISPFNKRGQIFSVNFSQLTMLHTIEQMLAIKPLNQFDAAAVSMRPVFTDRADYKPFTAHRNEVALNLINPPLKKLSGLTRHWAAVCARLDFSAPDRADPQKLTEALWHHTHGGETFPQP